ncbi:hypothetical protein [Acetanaerobacterium elongatum]|uniref:Uncharacterized protein n=1 Tax=Acetanaerobacterium elongatum TaxID=258515 RepID=A0A1G9YYR1_9FIRM|nr:hypothetical protein [Acetanaerobacterium elongatum]SDN14240.1 hypothetical protein SAMN05192585_11230 [Acetanaerobacterium elongatum]
MNLLAEAIKHELCRLVDGTLLPPTVEELGTIRLYISRNLPDGNTCTLYLTPDVEEIKRKLHGCERVKQGAKDV